jgi:hypothetical protein
VLMPLTPGSVILSEGQPRAPVLKNSVNLENLVIP